MKKFALLAMLMVTGAQAWAGDAAWPQFRGPTGQGVIAGSLPLEWAEDVNIRWKTPLLGRGWSSPVVADGAIWVTTAEEHAGETGEREALLKTIAKRPDAEDMVAFASVTLAALELDAATGKLRRRIELFTVQNPPPIHGVNSFASPTPILAGGRVYCHFGTYGTACIDAESGEVLWRKEFKLDHIVGPGSTPALAGNVLIIPCDGADKQYVVGLDVNTGDPVWKKDRPPIRSQEGDRRKAFSTPLVIEVNGKPQAVIPGAQWFIAYDPATGDEIWRVDHGDGFSNVPRPVFDGKVLYLCTGFGRPQLWAVKPDGSGDVTDTHVLWKQTQQIPSMSSPVVSEDRIYVISDNGVASCLQAKDGKPYWRERVPGKYSASPVVGDGRVYFASQEGRTTVLADSAEFKELAKNDLDGMQMASPAAVEGDLILRTDANLYRVGAKPELAAGGK